MKPEKWELRKLLDGEYDVKLEEVFRKIPLGENETLMDWLEKSSGELKDDKTIKDLHKELEFENMPKEVQDIVLHNFRDEIDSFYGVPNLSKSIIIEESDHLKKQLLCRVYGGRFDSDDSNGTCPLAGDIYNKLWGWKFDSKQPYDGKWETPKTFSGDFKEFWEKEKFTAKEEGFRFGTNSDTMNSFNTTLGGALSSVNSLKQYTYRGGVLEAKLLDDFSLVIGLIVAIFPNVHRFAMLTGTIGNFTLIPNIIKFEDGVVKHFNRERGRNGKYKDFWDLSLMELKNNKDFGEFFNEYIDTFYLWDYVDRHYNPKLLFEDHLDENAPALPNGTNEEKIRKYNEFFANASKNILKRGTLMVIFLMLKKY